MHIASKVTIAIGVILLIGSAVGLGLGIGDIVGLGEESTYLDEQSSGTFTVNENESWDIVVYIIHPVDCESIDLTIVDSTGTDAIGYDGCYNDDMMTYNDGDRESYATMVHVTPGMEYTLNSNVKVDVVGSYCDDACMEEAIGGGIAIAGGFVGICCSIPIIIIGIILAFVMDDPKVNTIMPVGQMPVGQATYQAPITGQAPVAQTIHQPPVEQAIQPVAVPVTPITPPLTQQPPVEQTPQPAEVPVTPITPPLTQQPVQEPWWDEKPPQ